jgi:hypothetical protein
VEFSIDFAGDPQDVTITASGAADTAGFAELDERLLADPRFRPGLAYLVDLSAVDADAIPQTDVERIAARGAETTWHYPPRAVAVVASNPKTLEQAQLAIAYMGGRKSNHRAFATRDEAVAWLREQR